MHAPLRKDGEVWTNSVWTGRWWLLRKRTRRRREISPLAFRLVFNVVVMALHRTAGASWAPCITPFLPWKIALYGISLLAAPPQCLAAINSLYWSAFLQEHGLKVFAGQTNLSIYQHSGLRIFWRTYPNRACHRQSLPPPLGPLRLCAYEAGPGAA